MDAALLLIMLALRARSGAMTGRAACGQPGGRVARRASCRMADVRSGVAAWLWRGGRDAVLVRRNARQHGGRGHVRSAWVRAMCEMSLVRFSDR